MPGSSAELLASHFRRIADSADLRFPRHASMCGPLTLGRQLNRISVLRRTGGSPSTYVLVWQHGPVTISGQGPKGTHAYVFFRHRRGPYHRFWFVCRTWERSRSALYARRARAQCRKRGDGPARRGPTPALSDAQLLAAIRGDLARSPFQGEGHRKVHARLRILDNIRVSRTRVLRVMRAQGLLSPHRGRQGDPKAHDETIVTSAPCVMWGTDGVRVFTAEDGWVWTFAAVDHWNAECVGWHVCKVGSRFAALEPIAQGLGRLYGSVEADVARGLALRMDHGSQYLSDHFLNQVRYWGIHPSFGLLEEPETNGVVERWNRTLKEQAIYGRVFHNLAEVRAAVAAFVERYNQCWRLEKLAYRTPLEAREEYKLRQAA